MHQISRPFWQLPTIGIIQFPWRLLSITTFTSAFLLATLKKPALPLAIVAIATTLIYTQPSTRTHLPDSFYSTNEDTTTVQGEYTPIWVKKPPTQRPKEPYQIVQGQAEVTNYLQTNISKSLKIKSGSDGSTIKLASLYYPGWQLTVNDSKSPIKYSQYDGHIAFDVPKGDSQVRVFWQETPLRHIANSISLAALISLGVYSLTLLINKKSSKIYS